MNLTSLLTDNITEVLIKIIEFTQARQEILSSNISNTHNAGYIAKDLAVDEFSELLSNAIYEHSKSQRLVFCDTESIKFSAAGSFKAKPIVDEYAKSLHKGNPDEYLDLQINKLLENSINQRLAAELLRQKEEMTSSFE